LPKAVGPPNKKYNLWLKRKIQLEVEATSAKLQAASNA